MVKFIFWIRFEVLFKANIKDIFQGSVLKIKLNFKVQGKLVWLRLLIMPKLYGKWNAQN
jgi:hypothetical protein